ncbi:MAG: hypothetical protein IJN80_03570 [Clostridia bacterium]|nr:hypothetical protein [Clostridia bacterium]
MNETTLAAETAAAEEIPAPQQEQIAEEPLAASSQANDAPKGKEMPLEERSRHAARRREAEQQAAKGMEEQLRAKLLQHPLVKEAVGLIEETRFKQDLDQVRKLYPNMTAQSPVEVGEIYCRLMASGHVDPVVAYEAQMAADRRAEPIPQNMVSAKSAGGAALYYSSRELDSLTEQDLKDPAIFQKALASLSKLRS